MVTNRMCKHDIECYIVLDRMIADTKSKHTGKKVKHGLSDKEVRNLRESMKNLGVYKDEWDFDLVREDSRNYDRTLWKKFFPNEFYTDDEKHEIREEMWIHAMPSQYDCTGQEFTSWIEFYEVPAGTWIYHRKDYDF